METMIGLTKTIDALALQISKETKKPFQRPARSAVVEAIQRRVTPVHLPTTPTVMAAHHAFETSTERIVEIVHLGDRLTYVDN